LRPLLQSIIVFLLEIFVCHCIFVRRFVHGLSEQFSLNSVCLKSTASEIPARCAPPLARSASFTSVGHSGKFGHEFLEFELRPDGKLRYANNSQYKSDRIIRKEMYVGDAIVQEFKRIVLASEIIKYVVAGLIFKTHPCARFIVNMCGCHLHSHCLCWSCLLAPSGQRGRCTVAQGRRRRAARD
jgi:hypothetical protein